MSSSTKLSIKRKQPEPASILSNKVEKSISKKGIREQRREILLQESQNIRTNKCIDYFARRSGASTGVMGMNCAGNVGKSFHLKPFDDATIAIPMGATKLPINQSQIENEMMENTMVNLFNLKAHLLKIDQELKPGKENTTPIIMPQVFTTPPTKPTTASSLPSPSRISI